MEELQVKTEAMRDLDSITTRLDNMKSEMRELKVSVKRAFDNILPKVETLLANQASNVSNSVVVETQVANMVSLLSLFHAAQDNNVEVILSLLCRDDVNIKQRNEGGDSALHVAAKAGHGRAVTVLLGNIPIDFPSHQGRTALHYASKDGHMTVVRRLLNAGANADAKDSDGNFPLLLAAKAGHLRIVELLVNRKASVNAVDKTENSALVAAAKSKRWEIVEFLLLRGASTEIYKGDDNAPLYLVTKVKNYSLVINMIQQIEQKEEQMKILLQRCDDPYLVHAFEDFAPGFVRTQEGRDAMTQLAADGNVDVLESMLDRGPDVDGYDSEYGSTCLITAALNGQVNVMKMLLERGASVDLRHSRLGDTALHCAAEGGYVECVHVLLKAKASANIMNNQSETSIDVAKTEEIRLLLISHSPQC